MKILLSNDLHYGFNHKTEAKHKKLWKDLQDSSEQFDVAIFAGDLASHKVKQTDKCLLLFQEYFPDVPLYFVYGNHDYWSIDEGFSWDMMKVFRWNPNVGAATYVNGEVIELNKDIKLYGFDGWYGMKSFRQNDFNYIPGGIPSYDELQNRAHNQFFKLIDHLEKKPAKINILLTHFPPAELTPYHTQPFSAAKGLREYMDKFDIVLYGHAHKGMDTVINETRWVSSYSDYNNPKYTIIEI